MAGGIIYIIDDVITIPQVWFFSVTIIFFSVACLTTRRCIESSFMYSIACIECIYKFTAPSEREWLAGANMGENLKISNSTRWGGSYTQDEVCYLIPEFTMSVGKGGNISGEGKDNIGHYNLFGKQAGDRVALTKSYTPDFKVSILLTVVGQERLEGQWIINSERYDEGKLTFCSI